MAQWSTRNWEHGRQGGQTGIERPLHLVHTHTEASVRRAVYPACRGGLHVSAIMVGTHLGIKTKDSTQKAPEMPGEQTRSLKT